MKTIKIKKCELTKIGERVIKAFDKLQRRSRESYIASLRFVGNEMATMAESCQDEDVTVRFDRYKDWMSILGRHGENPVSLEFLQSNALERADTIVEDPSLKESPDRYYSPCAIVSTLAKRAVKTFDGVYDMYGGDGEASINMERFSCDCFRLKLRWHDFHAMETSEEQEEYVNKKFEEIRQWYIDNINDLQNYLNSSLEKARAA